LRKKTKFKRHCLGLSFDGLPKIIGVSFVDCAWEMIVGTTMDAKSSNFVAMKLIRFLNSVGVNLVWLTHLHKMRTPLLHFYCNEQVSRNKSNKPCMKELVASRSMSYNTSSSLEKELEFEKELELEEEAIV
jgi:hypothetical protein